MITKDGGKNVVAGNERVLRARLSDAKFFWDQDKKTHPRSRVAELKQIVFHAKLGTQRERVERIETLAGEIAKLIGADHKKAGRAAYLCKADLVSGTVGEFPEVQGVMGRYFALHDKEDPEVADAIRDHYKPQGQGDDVPTAPVSVAVALADKIDTLVGFFAIDEKPTGSKDPYALRRAALGVDRTILATALRIKLDPAFGMAADDPATDVRTASVRKRREVAQALSGRECTLLGRALRSAAHSTKSIRPCIDLLRFVSDRLKVALARQGRAPRSHRRGVRARAAQDDLVLIVRRVEALQRFLSTDDGKNLLAGYKRA